MGVGALRYAAKHNRSKESHNQQHHHGHRSGKADNPIQQLGGLVLGGKGDDNAKMGAGVGIVVLGLVVILVATNKLHGMLNPLIGKFGESCKPLMKEDKPPN